MKDFKTMTDDEKILFCSSLASDLAEKYFNALAKDVENLEIGPKWFNVLIFQRALNTMCQSNFKFILQAQEKTIQETQDKALRSNNNE